MYTSVILVALAGSMASSQPGLTWQQDYVQARTVAQNEKKPLAVFVGSGAAGYDKISREGKLSADLQKQLAENYVCVYVDNSTPAGQKLAADLAITNVGLVLSDRTTNLQAFHHNGDLSDADLTRAVTRFADPSVVVNTTATNASTQISMYPPNGSLNGGMMGTYGNPGYGAMGYPGMGYSSIPNYGAPGMVGYGNQGGMYRGGMYQGGMMFGGGGCPGGNCGRR